MFINPDRPGLPDVDTDFDYLRRHEVIDYVTEKYGAEKVSQIGTFTTLSTKAAFKDIGRGLGIDHNIINDMNKLIPIEGGSPMSIEDSLENVPELQQYNEQFPELFELSAKVESLPRSSSVHPCGVVITSVPIHNVSPLMRSKEGDAVSQYEGGTLEELGLIKFDFLGLKNLSVIHIANELVKKRHNVHIDPDKIDIYDEKIYKVIHEGHTSALFQIESSGMQSLFKGLNKVDFPSLVAGIALYRPGPMQHIPEYQARANGQKEVEYFHADAEEVLKETHGIMIYQEQLMQLAGIFGGYTPGEQDNLRKATGKKSQAVMDKVLPELRQRTLDSGYAEETADELIRLIEPFVGYGFNKSHSAA